MNQETRDAIQALHLHVYFRGGKALRGRKLNQREEELFKATSIVSNYLAKTKTLVEISRSYDEFIEGQGVAVELWGWLQDRGMAAPVRPLISTGEIEGNSNAEETSK